MLYNHERSLKATEERIRNSSIDEANKQLIFEFENYCFAKGLKIARVLKLWRQSDFFSFGRNSIVDR